MQLTTPLRFAGHAFLVAALAAAGACESPDAPPDPLSAGQAVYERAVGGLACADCHGERAVPRPNADWRPAGHPLAGVAKRASLWGGTFDGEDRLERATLLCASRFQYRTHREPGGGPDDDFSAVPLPREDLDPLLAYLRTFDGPADLVPTRPDDDVEPLFDLTGDPDRGEEVWRSACAVCHGGEGDGGLGPSVVGEKAVDMLTFAEYVRIGALGSGWMPRFRLDRLTDQDLADLAARYAE